jgi:aminoglycoside phosphotransferase (APT) family kinase protein
MLSSWPELVGSMLAQTPLASRSVVAINALTGGVSSDIVEIILDDGQRLCAKRALPKLKVASVWEAPVERNQYEVAWLRHVATISPASVPKVLVEDRDNRAVLMEFLPAEDYVLWKAELLAGRYDTGAPAAVAGVLAQVHAATWRDAAVEREFPTGALFDALRLDPYLRTLTLRWPALKAPLEATIAQTAATRLALVHGDVSPKNILLSRTDGHPVLLDAECAWFGDPAFDAAFCMNHLLLKALHLPLLRGELFEGAATFLDTWLAGLPAAERADSKRRTLWLLPCLLLARVDGKSPVEYLDDDNRARVRRVAPPLIEHPPDELAEIVSAMAAVAQGESRS